MNNYFSHFQKYHFVVALLSIVLLLSLFSLEDEKTCSTFSTDSPSNIELLESQKKNTYASFSLQKAFSAASKNPALLFLLKTQVIQNIIQAQKITAGLQTFKQAISELSLFHFQRFLQPSLSTDEDDTFQSIG